MLSTVPDTLCVPTHVFYSLASVNLPLSDSTRFSENGSVCARKHSSRTEKSEQNTSFTAMLTTREMMAQLKFTVVARIPLGYTISATAGCCCYIC